MITIVAAIGDGGVIGANGRLPWPRLPADMERFRNITMGKPVIMGRKTFESLPMSLTNRPMIVLSRRAAGLTHGHLARSLAEAIELARKFARCVTVIGGADVYAQALPLAGCMRITRVHGTFAGDAFFPPYDESEWRMTEVETREADETTPHALEFVTLERIGGPR